MVATALFVLVGAVISFPIWAQNAGSPESTTWNGLKGDVFGQKPIEPANGIVSIDAPKRAEDAAIVPGALFKCLLAPVYSGTAKTVS